MAVVEPVIRLRRGVFKSSESRLSMDSLNCSWISAELGAFLRGFEFSRGEFSSKLPRITCGLQIHQICACPPALRSQAILPLSGRMGYHAW